MPRASCCGHTRLRSQVSSAHPGPGKGHSPGAPRCLPHTRVLLGRRVGRNAAQLCSRRHVARPLKPGFKLGLNPGCAAAELPRGLEALRQQWYKLVHEGRRAQADGLGWPGGLPRAHTVRKTPVCRMVPQHGHG